MKIRINSFFLKLILPLLFIGLGFIGFNYFVKTKSVEVPKEIVERSWNVSVVEADPAEVTSEINLYGELVSARSVDLRSLVGGEIIEVSDNLKEGARVTAGSVLVEVDPFDYDAIVREREAAILEAKSRLAELEAAKRSDQLSLEQDIKILELEQRSLQRAEQLRKKGNISDKALDDAKTSISRQRQQVDQRRAQVDIQGARIGQQIAAVERQQVALERAQRDLQNVSLVAPFTGYLQNVSVELGKKIDAKDLVAKLIDDTRIEVKFHLSNTQYGNLLGSETGLIGRPVQILWKAGERAFEFSGVIKRIGSSIQSNTGGVEIYALLNSTPNLAKVRVGAFVEISMSGAMYKNALRIPDYALYDGDIVYKVQDGRLAPVEVVVLQNEGTSLIVRADGLKRGDKILTTRFAEVGPGIKVEVR